MEEQTEHKVQDDSIETAGSQSDNDDILRQIKSIINLYEIGEEDKMHDAIEGLRLMCKPDAGAKLQCSDGLLLKLLEEMRTETTECLWGHADAEGLDKQTCVSMTAKLEDFFNRKMYDIKRKQ